MADKKVCGGGLTSIHCTWFLFLVISCRYLYTCTCNYLINSWSVIYVLSSTSQLSILVHPDKNLEDRERAQKAFDGTHTYGVCMLL